MSTKPESGPSILPYESEAYRSHKDILLDLQKRAEQLGLLQRGFFKQIFTRVGIVCDRPRGDDFASISRSYFGLSIRYQRDNVGESPERVNEIRTLLRDVLAAHLSINEAPLDQPRTENSVPYEMYGELLEELEAHCATHGIPSLRPNLFLASSLFSRLSDSQCPPINRPGMTELFRKLSEIFAWQDKHLHAIVTALSRQPEGVQPAMDCIQEVAKIRSCAVQDLFAGNPLLAEVYIQSLFQTGRFEQAAQACEALGPQTLVQSVKICELYVRSLIDNNKTQECLRFLEENPDIPLGNRSLKKAVGIAIETIGWWLYGMGEYLRAAECIERFAEQEIGLNGRDNMNALYKENLQMLGDEQRLADFHRRLEGR